MANTIKFTKGTNGSVTVELIGHPGFTDSAFTLVPGDTCTCNTGTSAFRLNSKAAGEIPFVKGDIHSDSDPVIDITGTATDVSLAINDAFFSRASSGGALNFTAFSSSIPFDRDFTAMEHVVTGPLTLVPSTTNDRDGGGTRLILEADGTNTPDISAFGSVSGSYGNVSGNLYRLYFVLHKSTTFGRSYELSIADLGAAPDITAPTRVSSVIISAHVIRRTLSENAASSVSTGNTFVIDGVAGVITGQAVSGNHIDYTFSNTMTDSSTATDAYDATTGDITDTSSNLNPLASYSAVSCTNTISAYDSDAQAYFTRAAAISSGALTTTESDAWDAFVIAAKSNGYYSKFVAAYPYMGGANGARLLNAISTSYNATVVGGVTLDATGMTPNGTTGYLNTGLNPSTDLSNNDCGMGFVSGTNSTAAIIDMGCFDGTTEFDLMARWSDGDAYGTLGGTTFHTPATSSLGLTAVNRESSSVVKIYRNGAALATGTPSGVLPNATLFIGAFNSSGTASSFSNRLQKFSFVSASMSATQEGNFYTDLSTFLTAISR